LIAERAWNSGNFGVAPAMTSIAKTARCLWAALFLLLPADRPAIAEETIEQIIAQNVAPMIPADGRGGVAFALRRNGQTLFFNYGWADRANERRVDADSLFNLASLRKIFEATLLALAVRRGEISLDDPVAKYVVELQQGNDIRQVTFGQLASHTSGLLLPQDHPSGPTEHYTLAQFIRALKAWKSDPGEQPGKQHRYTHAGFVLLQLALERRFGAPIETLIEREVLKPLGMTSTILPPHDEDGRSMVAPALMRRFVQGYSQDGEPIGEPGNQETYYDFPGGGQMFSSARDLAILLAANLGELPIDRTLQSAMRLTQRGIFRVEPRVTQAMAWEVNDFGGPVIVDKPGGRDSSSAYFGMVPSKNLGIVILSNRGFQHPYDMAREVLLPALARITPGSRRAQ